MAPSTATTSRLLLLSAAVLLAIAAAGSSAAAPSSSCAPGAISERDQIPGCGWYVASRVCNGVVGMYPPDVFEQMCCQQLEAVPPACRCKALRAVVETPFNFLGDGREAEACRLAQARSGHDVVAKAECGLPAVHGWPICSSE